MTKAGFHVIDADGHVTETVDLLLPYADQPYRERLERLIEWKRQNASGGHLKEASLPYSELAQGYERTGRRLLGTRDIADNLEPDVVERLAHGKLGHFHEERSPGAGIDPDVSRADLDGLGIDQAVWFPSSTTSAVAIDEPEFEAALCRAYNRWVGEFCAAHGDDFFAVAVMPHWDQELAVEEIERVAQERWCVGVTSAMTLPDKLPDHPYFEGEAEGKTTDDVLNSVLDAVSP